MTPKLAPKLAPFFTRDNQIQYFVEDTRLHFRLRKYGCDDTPCYVFASFRYAGKTYRVNTTVRVRPSQWDRMKERGVISSKFDLLDNQNNAVCNEFLHRTELAYFERLSYFYANGEVEGLEMKLAHIINPNYKMSKQKQVSEVHENNSRLSVASTIETDYIEKNYKGTNTEGTYKTYLRRFRNYIENSGGKVSDTWDSVGGVEFWDGFKAYLVDLGLQCGSTNFKMCREWYFAVCPRGLCRNPTEISHIKYKGKKSNSNYAPLTYEEIIKIMNLTDEQLLQVIKEKELETTKHYRDLWCLQCLCGTRLGDVHFLAAVEGQTDWVDNEIIMYKDGIKHFRFLPEKSRNSDDPKKALIPFNLYPEIEPLYEKVKGYHLFKRQLDKTKQKTYNTLIRVLCRIAKITRKLPFTEKTGKKTTKPLCDFITAHDARHTFVTNAVLVHNKKPNEIKEYTGHTDEQYIEKVYKNLTDEQRAEVMQRNQQSKASSLKLENRGGIENLREGLSVIEFLGARVENRESLTFEDVVRLVQEREGDLMDRYGVKPDLLKAVFNVGLPMEKRADALGYIFSLIVG